MMADDAVMEFPYAPPGGVQRLVGRAALTEHLRGFADILAIEQMTEPTVHRTQEPGVVILEFGCIGRGVKTGQPYNQVYISVIKLRDGRIVHYRDYWNPLLVIAAVGGAAAITGALSDGGR
jgi:ketosteroid isomerase-like protein